MLIEDMVYRNNCLVTPSPNHMTVDHMTFVKSKNIYSKIAKGIYSDKILNSEWGKVNWNLVDSNEMKKLLILG